MLWFLLAACSSPSADGQVRRPPVDRVDTEMVDTEPLPDTDTDVVDTDPPRGPCPNDTELVEDVCMDRYEAPNRKGAVPLVMYTFDDAVRWCQARNKRLCTDIEWLKACEGPNQWAWPYGDERHPGRCNDDKVWRVYSATQMAAWPPSAASADIESLQELLDKAALTSPDSSAHIAELYQGTQAGDTPDCGGHYGVYDLTGNVEEWTRRADGGTTSFHGNLKGRYWAEARTCQSGVTTHGDPFRFYEIGFRCCSEPDYSM
jgi:formylglycine-generating enzyme